MEFSTSASGDGATREGNPMQTLLGDALRDIERLKEEIAWLRSRESRIGQGDLQMCFLLHITLKGCLMSVEAALVRY